MSIDFAVVFAWSSLAVAMVLVFAWSSLAVAIVAAAFANANARVAALQEEIANSAVFRDEPVSVLQPGAPPTRISVEEGDPGFAALWALRSAGYVRTFLDGVEQELCITADVEQGYVKRYRAEGGRLRDLRDGLNGLLTEECHGAVTISFQSTAEREAECHRAYFRGMNLLCEWLSPAQFDQFNFTGAFEVVGSQGGRYRVSHGLTDELDAHGEVVARWCFGLGGRTPIGDVMLARKLALETDEAGTRLIANRQPVVPAGWIFSP